MKLARIAALALTLGIAANASARDTAKDRQAVICKDGSTSEAGRGACSGHGGVDKAATKKAKAAARAEGKTDRAVKTSGRAEKASKPAKPAQAAKPVEAAAPAAAGAVPAAAKTGAQAPASHGSKMADEHLDPKGAIAKCKDGTYSHAHQHEGACSSHGGVAEWMDKK